MSTRRKRLVQIQSSIYELFLFSSFKIVEPILVNRGGASSDDSEEEPAPPEPFEYKED